MCVDKGTGAMSSSPMAHTSAWAWARNPPHWHHLMPHKRLRPVTRHRHLTPTSESSHMGMGTTNKAQGPIYQIVHHLDIQTSRPSRACLKYS